MGRPMVRLPEEISGEFMDEDGKRQREMAREGKSLGTYTPFCLPSRLAEGEVNDDDFFIMLPDKNK